MNMIANSVSAVYSMRQKSKPWLVSIAVMMAASQLLGVDLDGSWGFRFEEGKPLEEVAKADFEAARKTKPEGELVASRRSQRPTSRRRT